MTESKCNFMYPKCITQSQTETEQEYPWNWLKPTSTDFLNQNTASTMKKNMASSQYISSWHSIPLHWLNRKFGSDETQLRHNTQRQGKTTTLSNNLTCSTTGNDLNDTLGKKKTHTNNIDVWPRTQIGGVECQTRGIRAKVCALIMPDSRTGCQGREGQ